MAVGGLVVAPVAVGFVGFVGFFGAVVVVELVVVRLNGRFGGKRMLAVEDLFTDLFGLRTPFAAWQIEDSPALSDNRHAAEDPYRARSYWRFEEPAAYLAAA